VNDAEETPDLHGAYPRLTDDQLRILATYGERRPTQEGDVLFREGDRSCDFYVVLEGAVAIVEGYDADEQVIGVHGPGRFLGELGLLTGEAVFVTAVVRRPGAVLVVPVERLRKLVAQDTTLGNVILHAYLVRRSLLIGLGTGIRIIGSRFSPDTRRLREFAARNRLPHRFIDVERDATAEALLQRLGVGPDETPVVVWQAQVLRNPSTIALAELIGLHPHLPDETVYDLVIVGAGPAGLAASVYGASEGLQTIVIEGVATGGQAGTAPRIENYLGFPTGISGGELTERAVIQAEKFGACISVPAAAAHLDPGDGRYVIGLDDGTAVVARTVVIATGAHYRKLPVPRLEEFEGTSVYYAATQVEAMLCAGDPVAVVGGGNSAGQAALFLAKHAARVRLLVRSDDLGANMSRYLVDRIERSDIDVRLHTVVCELVGHGALDAIVVQDTRAGEKHTLDCKALFVFIGADPHVEWLAGQVALDEHGFVLTGADVDEVADPAIASGHAGIGDGDGVRKRSFLETSERGVFAVGDVRSGSTKRVAAAVGEGSMAVRLVHEHLDAAGQLPI
jgi:thioredoxin reductase (NADPH)